MVAGMIRNALIVAVVFLLSEICIIAAAPVQIYDPAMTNGALEL
jgi:hypothetical protein